MVWIDARLNILGFINRKHLMAHFRISAVQASTDLQNFLRNYPGRMTYDMKAKRYVAVRPNS